MKKQKLPVIGSTVVYKSQAVGTIIDENGFENYVPTMGIICGIQENRFMIRRNEKGDFFTIPQSDVLEVL